MSDLKNLSEQINWNSWQKQDPRFRRLEVWDRFLDGNIYDHLLYPFSQEEDVSRSYIPIYQRRPSVPINIPAMVAKLSGRKLFSGRHAPTVAHETNKDLLDRVRRLTEEAKLESLMPEVVFRGSVGAVAVSFKIVGKGNKGRIRCFVWNAKWCYCRFDEFGELDRLRIAYTSSGSEFIATDKLSDYKGKKIEAGHTYWHVQDLTKTSDIVYKPIKESEFKPSTPEAAKLVIDEEVSHKLGFVQAQWFQNLSGGSGPDGACTWESAVPLKIDIDYSLSQLGRAVRYNASPQIVTIGSMAGEFNADKGSSKTMVRAPHVMIMMKGAVKSGDSERGAGDVKLLEMTGNGVKVGLEYVDKIFKIALQLIAAQRKDPDTIKGGVITGKAMELLDEDLVDLVQELRTSYGAGGLLPLIKKMAIAAKRARHPLMRGANEKEIDGLMLDWPRTYNPTPAETTQLTQAAQMMKSEQLLPDPEVTEWLRNQLDQEENSANQVPEITPETKDLSTTKLDDTVSPAA